ncbi:MAG: hypothetical protein ABEJ76_00595 [Halanaeroarchaeum sp.]
MLGFLAFLAVMGFRAFETRAPLPLFWFAFAGFFSSFGYRWPRLRYLDPLGLVGLLVAVLGLAGLLSP